jgi:uncharacterized NAD-dependent epimerase/dehydratase family protein
LSQRPLIGIGLNHERLPLTEAENAKKALRRRFKVPVEDPVVDGVEQLADAIENLR